MLATKTRGHKMSAGTVRSNFSHSASLNPVSIISSCTIIGRFTGIPFRSRQPQLLLLAQPPMLVSLK